MDFKENEANWDKLLRLIVGIPLGIWGVYLSSFVWALIGIILTITGITGHCGLYSLFGFSTISKKK